MKVTKLNIAIQNKMTDETYNETQPNKYIPLNTNSSNSDKIEFLDILAKDTRKDSFIKILVKEALKINQTNNFQKKICNINLKENDIEGLYEWPTLFNNSRPLSHYTRTNYKKNEIEEDENDNLFNNIISPKVLVDLPNDKMNYFFGKNSFGNSVNNLKYKNNTPNFRKNNKNKKDKNVNLKSDKNIKRRNSKLSTWKFSYKCKENTKNNNKIKEESKTDFDENNHIKPISVYWNHGPKSTFYFSNTFSDYYKEDLKSFTKKMPILKAKIKTNTKRLKTEIEKEKNEIYIKEKILYDIIQKDNLDLRKQDLIISAQRKNPVPLMKYIFKKEYPNEEIFKEHIKKYFKTMKPYGNDDGKVDYTQNDRWRLTNELIKFRKMELSKKNKNKKSEKSKGKLILSYYDMNDPDLEIFNKLNLENEDNKDNDNNDKKNCSFENKNNFGNTYDFRIELKNKAKTIEIERIRPRSGFRTAKDINILKSEKNKFKNRPHSSNIRRVHNFLDERYYFDIKDYNELYKDYMPSNRFPTKTSSKIINTSYNKINELMKERFFKNKMNDNYFITEPDFKIEQKYKIKKYINNYNDNKHLYLNDYYGNKNSKKNKKAKIRPNTAIGIRNKKCNILDFNKYIDTNYDLKMSKMNEEIYFTPMNCFNKLAGKYYSSSNNVHIKNKRNKRKNILDINKKNSSKK